VLHGGSGPADDMVGVAAVLIPVFLAAAMMIAWQQLRRW
jgi:hypothetical protein